MTTEIVLNERAVAERAIENLDLGTNPYETLNRVARYYFAEGHKKKLISGMLEDFLLRCDSTANIVKWQDAIDRCAKNADRYALIDLEGVCITEAELQKIDRIVGKSAQKLMFTMLCLAKYNNAVHDNNNDWINYKGNLFSLANLSSGKKRQSLILNDLWREGLIGYSRVVDNINMNVRIIDNESPVALIVTDFRNLGNQYLRYKGEKYFECENCGLVVKKESNAQCYCKLCAAEINRQKTAENRKKTTVFDDTQSA